MLRVAFSYCYDECRYAECHYAEHRHTECRYVNCHYSECHQVACHYAECRLLSVVVPQGNLSNTTKPKTAKSEHLWKLKIHQNAIYLMIISKWQLYRCVAANRA